jgi:adenosine/AMP kinase
MALELRSVKIEIPEDANIIIGQTHFIKSVEDIYEAMVTTVPGGKFGIAFNEASGPCLVRFDGNNEELKQVAVRNAQEIGAGHTFVVVMKDCYPINVLNRIKDVPEVCGIYCATANPVEVIVAQGESGRALLGVIDGSSPKGVESQADIETRKGFLRKIGYKR